MGSRRVTTYIERGEEYDVILEGERESQRTPAAMDNIYVRSTTTGQLIPLEGQSDYTIGRVSDGQSILPDIDLAPFDGYSQGVSRLFCVSANRGASLTIMI